MAGLADLFASDLRRLEIKRDEEHNLFRLEIEDHTGPYSRTMVVGAEYVLSGDFRALAATWRDIKDLKWPATVVTLDGGQEPELDAVEEDDTQAEAAPGNTAPARPAAAKPKSGDARIENLDELVEFFFAAGKRGIAINRYKGLGEMNPEQLWATTMDPSTRTLLQVRAEDHTEADLMFTTLMGDQVEPRRKFIEDNALDVKNLDI